MRIVIAVAITLIVFGLLSVFLMGAKVPAGSNQVVHTIIEPITDSPMQEYTQYFEKYAIDVTTSLYVRNYTFYWHAPEAVKNQNEKFPLVMVLHGSPGNSYAAEYLVAPPLSQKYPAFIFVPVLEERQIWADPPEGTRNLPTQSSDGFALNDTVRMIKSLEELYPIDASRIYVVGCSLGGTGAYGAARYFPDVFAAAVPMSGTWNPADAPGMIHVPMWILHGRLDPGMSAESTSDIVELDKSYGGQVLHTEFDDMGHNCTDSRLYSEDVWRWLFSQKRSQ